MDEVFLVAAVTIALPPEKTGDLVGRGTWVVGLQISQHWFCLGHVSVILHPAGIPMDWFGIGAFPPTLGRTLVSGVNPGDPFGVGELEALAAEGGGDPNPRPGCRCNL